MRAPDVVVVGGGASGLSTAAALGRAGVDAVVLDRNDRVGASWDRRYERLCLHTVRTFSGLAYRRIPRRYPRYLPKGAYADYLREYAEHFGLDVRLGEIVRHVAPDDSRWRIETNSASHEAHVVVIATGHYNDPRLPDWPGRASFAGRLLHSADYRTGREFAGKRALVVGIGNSGAEIAADFVEQGAADVAIAVRTPPPIVTRELLGGVPVQLIGIALQGLPPQFVDRIGAKLRRRAVGDLSRYGLRNAGWGPFTARRPAVIDVGFLAQLKAGRISVRPAVRDLTRDGVLFADGSDEPFDVVVAATGFGTGLDAFLDVPGAVRDDGQPSFRSGRPTPHPGLYFVGFDETVRGHLFEANRESRRLARTIAAYLASRDEPFIAPRRRRRSWSARRRRGSAGTSRSGTARRGRSDA